MSCKIALLADNHFIYDNNCVYVNGTYTQNYLKRFTDSFEEVIVLARGRKKTDNDSISNMRLSGGERVSFRFLNDFYGLKSFILNRRLYKKEILSVLQGVDGVIVRMPSLLTNVVIECAKKLTIPFFIDLGADPESIYKSYRPTVFELSLSLYMKVKCKTACMQANGVSYVTKATLQKKYPCKALCDKDDNFITASISNVDITSDFYYKQRDYSNDLSDIRLLHISNNIVKNSAKGHFESLIVLNKLIKLGYNASLTFLGEGDGIAQIKNRARRLGILNKVFFKGRIADRNEYKQSLLDSNFFIFPSHAEGLPRSLIEAMSTGMICLASNVDGIPELLDPLDVFNYSDTNGFVNRIKVYVSDALARENTSKRNYLKSTEYSNDSLRKTFSNYYANMRRLIEKKAEGLDNNG